MFYENGIIAWVGIFMEDAPRSLCYIAIDKNINIQGKSPLMFFVWKHKKNTVAD